MVSEEKTKEIKRLSSEGLATRAIAKRIGMAQSTVQRTLKYIAPEPEKLDEGKIMALWRACWPVSEIADEMRITEETVERVVRERRKI